MVVTPVFLLLEDCIRAERDLGLFHCGAVRLNQINYDFKQKLILILLPIKLWYIYDMWVV